MKNEQREFTCEECKHFRQHYIKFSRRYSKILYGHCVYPRLKKRYMNDKACDHFKNVKKDL